ncbi:DinB family protein [Paenibacillus contaminans]|uniref:DinB family protein n=1 Tax=Paenibacillus contaminans TaxID=450362 RepID=A0A329MSM4_9BACL|nr:DinB family protein [Paenibacillus contaminans]RAV22794.1 DinB family protein [Paenibacillus contaminans]
MSFEAVYPVWRTVRDRFQKSMQNIKTEELNLKLSADTSSIGHMLRHNAEVEYMFADWFFKCAVPEGITFVTSGPGSGDVVFSDLQKLLEFSEASDRHLSAAMRALPEEAWDQPVASPLGTSTPREALGRALYHTGLHAGQISLIRKCAQSPTTT